MKKSISAMKKSLAMLLCFVMAFSCFAISGVYAEGHIHSYGEWIIDKAATCSQEGLKYKTCLHDDCGNVIEAVIPVEPTAHVTDGAVWTVLREAKCNEAGLRKTSCTACGIEVTEPIPVIPHTFDESKWEITKVPIHLENQIEDGFRVNSCLKCAQLVTEVLAVEHVFDESAWSLTSEATCSKQGVEVNTCTHCLAVISRYTDFDPDKHTYSSYPEEIKPPTCLEDGIGLNKCDDCGKISRVVIPVDYSNPKHTFNYDDKIVEECDRVTVHCTTCNNYIESETEHAHTVYEDTWVITANPTCTTLGQKKGVCSKCHKTITVGIPVVAGNHSYGEWAVIITPDCDTEGLRVRVCKHNYGHKQYETLQKLPHRYETEWTIITEATCVAEGEKVNHCVLCDKDVHEVIPVDSEAHDLEGEWVRTKAPTCTEEGTETNHCKREGCGDVTRAIPMHTDDYAEYDRFEPNCSYDGISYLICKKCSHKSTAAIPLEPDAHGYYVTTPAICSKEGEETCRFDTTHKRAIPVDPEAHTYPEDWTYPTDCSVAGVKTKTCTGCGNVISESYTPGHTVGDWTFSIGDCFNGGTVSRHCTRCGILIEAKDVEAGEHAYAIIETKKNNCTEEGYDVGKCTFCGKEEKINIVPARGHMIMIMQEGKDPTCTEEGRTPIYRCIDCDFIKAESEAIPALGHNFVLQDNGNHSCTRCYVYIVNGDVVNPELCGCVCHNQDGLAKFFFRILKLFYKLFGTNQFCECGIQHYENTSIFEDLFGDFDIDLGGAHPRD